MPYFCTYFGTHVLSLTYNNEMEYKSEELFQVLTFNLASITQIKGVIDHSMLPENLRRVRNI